MKPFYIYILLAFNLIAAQDIAIPYRDGNLWGICNPDGTILIKPQFDKVEFLDEGSDTHEILIPKNKDKRGLIIKGKLVFDAIYDNIYEKNGNYVLIKTDDSGKTTEYVDKNGKSLFPNPVIHIINSKNSSPNGSILHVLNKDLSESILVFNQSTQENFKLYDKYYSLKIFEKVIEATGVPIMVKKSENDNLMIEVWDFSKFPPVKVKDDLANRTEQEYFYKFYKKSNEYNDREYSSGNGSSYAVEEVRADSYHDVVVEAPNEVAESKPKTVYYYNSFKRENEKLYFLNNNYSNSNQTNKIELKLNPNFKNIEIKNSSFSQKKNDTIKQYNHFVTYRNKNKYGFLFSEDLKKAVEFDTVLKTSSYREKSSYNKEIILVVGNKDKSNKMNYNFYSNVEGFLYPTFFDQITEVISTKYYTKNYLTRHNNKFGLVATDATEILKPEYDEITDITKQQNTSYRNTKLLFKLVKDNKFGLIYQNSNGKQKIIEAKFDFQIKELIENYPRRKYEYSKEKSTIPLTQITLIILKDNEGKFLGYANTNGLLYFKN